MSLMYCLDIQTKHHTFVILGSLEIGYNNEHKTLPTATFREVGLSVALVFKSVQNL